MLECICHLRHTQLSFEGPEEIPFIRTVRNEFMREAPAFLKTSVIHLLCGHDVNVGTVLTELGNLNAT